MTLAASIFNSLHRAFGYTKALGNSVSGVFASADFYSLSIRYLIPMRALTNGHVAHVVVMRSKIEMLWVYAKAIVAFVQNKKPLCDLSLVNQPRNAMSAHLSIKNNHFSRLVRATDIWSVAGAAPKPTAIGLKLPFRIKLLLEKFFGVSSVSGIWSAKNALFPAPAFIVVLAEPAPFKKLPAPFNRANAFCHEPIVSGGWG